MQNAASFLRTLNALVLDEMLQILPFNDIVGLALTDKELLERITGQGDPPRTVEEHAVHRSGRAYAWSGILDRIGLEFGMHTDVDKCTHPNPAIRKKVAESMRRLLSNKTDHPNTLLHNRLDSVVRYNSVRPLGFPRTDANPTFLSDRYLNWRRTFTLFLLYWKLQLYGQNEDTDNDYFNAKKTLFGASYHSDIVKHGADIAHVANGSYVCSVTDHTPQSYASEELIVRTYGTKLPLDRGLTTTLLSEDPLHGVIEWKNDRTFVVHYIDPEGDGTGINKAVILRLPGSTFKTEYFEKNGVIDLCVVQLFGDVAIIWRFGFEPIVIALNDDPIGNVVSNFVGKNSNLLQNIGNEYNRLNANPYLFVGYKKSEGATLNRSAYYAPIEDLTVARVLHREQLLFKRVRTDETSRLELDIWKSPRVSRFRIVEDAKKILFTDIDKDQTFYAITTYFPMGEVGQSVGEDEGNATANNLVVTVAKFNKTKLLKRVTFVIAHRYESDDKFFQAGNAYGWTGGWTVERNNNLIKLQGKIAEPFSWDGTLPSEPTLVIDGSDNRITFYGRNTNLTSLRNSLLDSLTYSIDTYESPDSDEPQQTIIQ